MNATAKCSVTTLGSSPEWMIQPPISAWTTNRGSSATASHAVTRSTGLLRISDHPPTAASARDARPARNARSRWVYSISVWYSNRGIHRPKHVGQSGHPSPEPVARTMPPHAISRSVKTAVVNARERNVRFMGCTQYRAEAPAVTWDTAAMSAAATASVLEPVVAQVDVILEAFLGERRAEAAAVDPHTVEPVEEIARLVHAGGKRLRPACTYWGYRAAGGTDGPEIWGGPAGPEIWGASAAVELLHTMALLHDDVMDADDERRGEPTAFARQTAAARARGELDPERVGVAVAIVAGDLAAAFAEQLFSTAGFPAGRQAAGAARLARMRLELALGAYLSVTNLDVDPATVAYLKGGAYTVEGPALLGAALAGATPAVDDALRAFARPLGAAFQMLDDLADGDAPPGASRAEAGSLVQAARMALANGRLNGTAAQALDAIARLVASL